MCCAKLKVNVDIVSRELFIGKVNIILFKIYLA